MELASTNKYERLYKSFLDKYSSSLLIIWDTKKVPLHSICIITLPVIIITILLKSIPI